MNISAEREAVHNATALITSMHGVSRKADVRTGTNKSDIISIDTTCFAEHANIMHFTILYDIEVC